MHPTPKPPEAAPKMQTIREPALSSSAHDRVSLRFIKSYKYKHKPRQTQTPMKNPSSASCLPQSSLSIASCDPPPRPASNYNNKPSNNKLTLAIIKATSVVYLATLLLLLAPETVLAFCPNKCHCNDQLLSANCTQINSLTTVPMTLNPLLRELTLSQSEIYELSNSLSIYRQLEILRLNSNQIRQIKYENFNFKAAPNLIALQNYQSYKPSASNLIDAPSDPKDEQLRHQQHHRQLNSHLEQLARNHKQAIDKSIISQSSPSSGAPSSSSSSSSTVDEIGFHLRELDLSDNKIAQLGNFDDDLDAQNQSEQSDSETSPQDDSTWTSSLITTFKQVTSGNSSKRRLKKNELERLAPFLMLIKLQRLNLAANRLSSLHNHVFLGLIHLKYLDLSWNQLDYIDKHSFVGLIELETLNLANNRLASQLTQLSLAYCRAPMRNLQYLDMSANQKTEATDVLLPNQMFICAPNLAGLKLDDLQLRYVQVNAFDNLQQLEWLNLSKNQLEQVPSDALGLSRSNLRHTLKHLDLSETQLEFVSANSLSSLKNLQKLSMNSMPKLVSFDLAAFNLMIVSSGESGTSNFQSTLRNLLPDHLYDRVGNKLVNSNPDQHDSKLINDQLAEIQLSNNHKLQSVHSSLVAKTDEPKGRIKFTRLRQIYLQNDEDLRFMPLEEMIDLQQSPEPINLDLSYSGKFNCSACQMSWLVDAARQARLSPEVPTSSPSGWDPIAFDPFMRPQLLVPQSKVKLSNGHLIGCIWPFNMPLSELLALETNFAPLFGHCSQGGNGLPDSGMGIPASSDSYIPISSPPTSVQSDPPALTSKRPTGEGSGTSTSGLLFVAILTLPLVLLLIKLIQTLLMRRSFRQSLAKHVTAVDRTARSGFKWRCARMDHDSALDSPASSSSTTRQHTSSSPLAADCSSSSIVSANHLRGGAYGNYQVVGGGLFGAEWMGTQQQQQQQQQHQQQPREHLANLRATFSHSPGPTGRSRRHVGQIERARNDGAGNLFSRIAGRLSGRWWKSNSNTGPQSAAAAAAAIQHWPPPPSVKGLAHAVLGQPIYEPNYLATTTRQYRWSAVGDQSASGPVVATSRCFIRGLGGATQNGSSNLNSIVAAAEGELYAELTAASARDLIIEPKGCSNQQQQAGRRLEAMASSGGNSTSLAQPEPPTCVQEASSGLNARQQKLIHGGSAYLGAGKLSPAGSFAAGSSGGNGAECAHIYVTLDRPIKQQKRFHHSRGRPSSSALDDELKAHFGAGDDETYIGPRGSHNCKQVGDGMDNNTGNFDPLESLSGPSANSGEAVKISANDPHKFKLAPCPSQAPVPSQAQGGWLMPACKLSSKLGELSLTKYDKGLLAGDPAAGNVTGDPNGDSRNISAVTICNFEAPNEPEVADRLYPQSIRLDANHGSNDGLAELDNGGRHDDDNDYVINGLEPKRHRNGNLAAELNGSKVKSFHQKRGGSADKLANGEIRKAAANERRRPQELATELPALGSRQSAAATEEVAPHDSIMIGQRNSSANNDNNCNNSDDQTTTASKSDNIKRWTPPAADAKRTNEASPLADHYQAPKYYDNCDTTTASKLASKKKRNNSDQIYSSQFYYCKPTTGGTPTLMRKQTQ